MKQNLVFPVRRAKITAGYMATEYFKKYGYNHYGVDMICVNDKYFDVYACGNGTVIDAGNDGANSVGNVVIIRYNDVVICDMEGNENVKDLICTYFHLQDGSIKVKKGDKVNAETKVGLYGKTGYGIEGEHLHIQFDTDVNNPYYCTGIAGRGYILKHGTVNSTVNPLHVLCNWDSADKDREYRGEFPNWNDDFDEEGTAYWSCLPWVEVTLQEEGHEEPKAPEIVTGVDKYKDAIDKIKVIVNSL